MRQARKRYDPTEVRAAVQRLLREGSEEDLRYVRSILATAKRRAVLRQELRARAMMTFVVLRRARLAAIAKALRDHAAKSKISVLFGE
jgi:hypothetical protein